MNWNYYCERKDIVDQRPIRLDTKDKLDSFLWKLRVLLVFDEKEQCHRFPFSGRKVDLGPPIWRRGGLLPMPPGFVLCRCIGCERKLEEDHLLNDHDFLYPEDGDLHLELINEPGYYELSSTIDYSSVASFDFE